jgi:hypothetical protein
MNADLIDKSYTNEYNSIYKAYTDTDEDDELTLRRCYMRAREMLDEPTIPLYHRIKTLLLLAGMVGMLPRISRQITSFANKSIDDVDEASAFLRRVEAQLIVAQKENGHVPAAEEALIELDATIKELRGVLANEDTGDAADIDHPLDTSQT